MANPRLPFLWPFLYRSTAETTSPPIRRLATATQRRRFNATALRYQEPLPQRYGPANEYAPHLGGGRSTGPSTPKRQSEQQEPKPLPKIGEKLQRDGEEEAKADSQEIDQSKGYPAEPAAKTDPPSARAIMNDPVIDSMESIPQSEPPGETSTPPQNAAETLLNEVPSPTQQQDPTKGEQQRDEQNSGGRAKYTPPINPPHIDAPRYVHHFDTYGLVKRLTDAGWDEAQAITMMKVTRLILAENMDLAKDALVSKSMVENESYLFKAACSELKTEVTTRRKGDQEKLRTERTQLQHEVDILGQRMGQESGGMKDELKGMFDDRKLAVRSEQRNMESNIQQLNYKITVSLQADAKSEVEGLRWVMTRRVITALGAVVFMVVGAIKVAASKIKEEEDRAKKAANMQLASPSAGGPAQGTAGSGSTIMGEEMVQQGDNPAFVSLG